MTAAIERVAGRRVWDSRGRPTVEVEVVVVRGGDGRLARGRAIAPAGASRGSGEACDRRDGGDRLGGQDVRGAVAAVNGEIAAALHGRDAGDQAAVDAALVALDGTPDRSRLGANALVATSMAVAWAAAAAADQPLWAHLAAEAGTTVDRLPLPEVQILGGGAHAAGALDLQDLMVVAPGAASLDQALEWTAEVYRAAGARLGERGRRTGVADEGGWWPAFTSNEEAVATLVAAIEQAGFAAPAEVAVSLDVAASELYDATSGEYLWALEGLRLDPAAHAARLLGWLSRHPIVLVEDPLDEHDLAGTAAFTAQVPPPVLVVADDLTVTDAERVRTAAAAGAGSALLTKPNQAGTVSEAHAALRAARQAGWRAIVSARSGETEDVTICHLAVGWRADLVKVGSITRGERTAKWNELLRIDDALGGVPLARPW